MRKRSIDQTKIMTGVTLRNQMADSINNIQPTVVRKQKTAIDKAAEAKSRNRPNTKRDR